VKNKHVKDGHVKDAAQDVAEDVLGAAEDGSVKVQIVAHVKDVAQGVAEDVPQDVA